MPTYVAPAKKMPEAAENEIYQYEYVNELLPYHLLEPVTQGTVKMPLDFFEGEKPRGVLVSKVEYTIENNAITFSPFKAYYRGRYFEDDSPSRLAIDPERINYYGVRVQLDSSDSITSVAWVNLSADFPANTQMQYYYPLWSITIDQNGTVTEAVDLQYRLRVMGRTGSLPIVENMPTFVSPSDTSRFVDTTASRVTRGSCVDGVKSIKRYFTTASGFVKIRITYSSDNLFILGVEWKVYFSAEYPYSKSSKRQLLFEECNTTSNKVVEATVNLNDGIFYRHQGMDGHMITLGVDSPDSWLVARARYLEISKVEILCAPSIPGFIQITA